MSPLTTCGGWISRTRTRERCYPCNGRGCTCCQGLGKHYFANDQEQAHGDFGGAIKADFSRPLKKDERACRCCRQPFTVPFQGGAKPTTCSFCKTRCITKSHTIRADSPHRRRAA